MRSATAALQLDEERKKAFCAPVFRGAPRHRGNAPQGGRGKAPPASQRDEGAVEAGIQRHTRCQPAERSSASPAGAVARPSQISKTRACQSPRMLRQVTRPFSANTTVFMSTELMTELLEAGVHFGHQTKRWNPKMKPFIFEKTQSPSTSSTSARPSSSLTARREFLGERRARANGKVLFVGCKKQAQEAIKEAAQASRSVLREPALARRHAHESRRPSARASPG